MVIAYHPGDGPHGQYVALYELGSPTTRSEIVDLTAERFSPESVDAFYGALCDADAKNVLDDDAFSSAVRQYLAPAAKRTA